MSIRSAQSLPLASPWTEQLLGDLVTVVADQGGAKVVPRRGRELQQEVAETFVGHKPNPTRSLNIRRS